MTSIARHRTHSAVKKSRRPELDPCGVVCLYGGRGLSRARSNLLQAVVVTLPRIGESSKKKKKKNFEQELRDRVSRLPPWTLLMPVWIFKKGNYHLKLCMPFVGLAPVRRLHPSIAVLYHVNGKLQGAYLKPLRCFIVCFVG